MDKDRFEQFNQMLASAAKSLQRIKQKHMEKYGLTSTHTICLRLLFENPDGLTKKEISDNCDVDKAQITRIIKDLLSKGYVIEDEADKAYNHKFFLTEEGMRITDEINSLVLKVNDYVSGSIPKTDIDSFYDTFDTINKNLHNAEKIF